ncbi:MAG: PstS family phosphate ABC transporter substrate-binding protein, partial [Phormidesmis sp. CAN_BIN36]|nr:PstS family phosphate ABC transporter substrate-binding protein [Phormidesmis sp. CAN_BIN36]
VSTYRSLAEVPNVPQGLFNYGGSTTFAPLRSPTIVTTLSQAHPQFQVRYTEPTTGKPGSGKGIEMLIGGQLSFAQSSRSLKDEEYAQAKNRGFALEEVAVALDGIALYVNPQLINQGVKGLTLAQVRDIFTGKINNWQAVGGPNLAITPVSRNLQAGGTVDFFYENVMEKQPLGANVKEVRDTTEAVRQVARVPGGIGYATAAEVTNQQTIRLVAIAKEEGSQAFVSPCADATCAAINEKGFADSSYPITRRLFVIIKRDGRLDEQAGVAYANMLLSDEGQKLSEQAGFVPIR